MIQAIPLCTLKARTNRVMPEAISRKPRVNVSTAAASAGFVKVTNPATIYNAPSPSQSRNPPQLFIRKAWTTSATPATSMIMPTTKNARDRGHDDAVERDEATYHVDHTQGDDPAPVCAQ